MNFDMIVVTPMNIGDVLSAIELDLRDLIVMHLGSEGSVQDLLGGARFSKSMERFEKERGYSDELVQLEDLLPFVDFADLYQVLNENGHRVPADLARYAKDCTPQLQKIVPIRNRVAHNRQLLYDDPLVTREVSTFLLVTKESIWRHLTDTVSATSRPQDEPFRPVMNNLPVPDYEETGYIGRKKQHDLVKKAILQGAYPVIAIAGDGGVGKTALALKVVRDILQSSENPFDAIIWTSAKAQQLTPGEIVRIRDAISDSFGMFRDIVMSLGATDGSEPIQEIMEYLRAFSILLIMDNLETVLDEKILEFLSELPRGNSRILITSRIGIGGLEPIRLAPLEEGDAIQLLRVSADVWQVAELSELSNKQISRYCARMQHNPLFIKWFVAAVGTGV